MKFSIFLHSVLSVQFPPTVCKRESLERDYTEGILCEKIENFTHMKKNKQFSLFTDGNFKLFNSPQNHSKEDWFSHSLEFREYMQHPDIKLELAQENQE